MIDNKGTIMNQIKSLNKTVLSVAIGVTLSLSLVLTSNDSYSATLPSGVVADENTSAHQQAAMRNAFSAPLAMYGTSSIDPGFLTLVGARVTGLDSCDGNIGLSITNSFTDGTLKKIYENFDDIITAVISPDGLIYLSALYIQKSNPGLYNQLTNGINLGVDNFASSLSSCKSILSAASTYIPESAIEKGRIGMTEDAVKYASEYGYDLSQVDIVDFMSSNPTGVSPEEIMKKGVAFFSSNGVPGTGGGELSDYPVIPFIETAAAKGYCILRGINATDCDAEGLHQVAASYASDIIDYPMFEIMFGDDEDLYMKNIQKVATQIYGDVLYTNCDGCSAVNIPGTGLQRFFESQAAEIASLIYTRVNASLDTMTAELIDEMSAPTSMIVTMPYIQSIKRYEDRPSTQNIMIQALATEVAYQRVLYISNLFEQIFQSMILNEETVDAKFQGQYESFSKLNTEQFLMFVQKEQSLGFKPGKYSKMILKMADGQGDIDNLMQSNNIE